MCMILSLENVKEIIPTLAESQEDVSGDSGVSGITSVEPWLDEDCLLVALVSLGSLCRVTANLLFFSRGAEGGEVARFFWLTLK